MRRVFQGLAMLVLGLMPAGAVVADEMPLVFYRVPVGESQIGNCGLLARGDLYRCTFEGLPPEPGYLHGNRVDDLFEEMPSLLVKVLSAARADVWVAYPGEGWQYLGTWQASVDGSCAKPLGPQTAEAVANLGQDDWQLCIR